MLEEQLKKHFNFGTFKKGQKQVVETLINRESAAAIFPTGSGKSLCYQLSAMLLPGMTLVVSPLLALMKDQLDFLLEHNIPAARLDSTLDAEEYAGAIEKAKIGELKILMISVERFKNERFRFHLEKMNISLMVVDEAHCISEWGHNFRPEYLKLPLYQKEFRIKQVLLLTATATSPVVEEMSRKFNVKEKNVVITGFYRENLFLNIAPVKASEKNRMLVQRIMESPVDPTIVYVTLQKTAERVAGYLCSKKINASPYHAGMKNQDRETIQNRFMEGQLHCVVATIAFGMGIDKKDLRRVIHYDLPKSIEHYAQEIGRAGRDDAPAFCETLSNRDSLNVLENFIYGDTPDLEAVTNLISKIKTNPDFNWEIRLTALSSELNIRLLPLRTLLVYLEMEGVIKPRYTFFADYSFKYISQKDEIINSFQDERKGFVKTILDHSHTRKVWTQVDLPSILDIYNSDRKRVITALEYFDEKGWIELNTRLTTEVFDIMTQAFDVTSLSQKIHKVFKTRETHEIKRVHNMVGFFESKACISLGLAGYFGEKVSKEKCGHCSVCKRGPAVLQKTTELSPLSGLDFHALTKEFISVVEDHMSVMNLTRFLCGIYTPVFSKLRVKTLAHFGFLEKYPFMDVKDWVDSKCSRGQ